MTILRGQGPPKGAGWVYSGLCVWFIEARASNLNLTQNAESMLEGWEVEQNRARSRTRRSVSHRKKGRQTRKGRGRPGDVPEGGQPKAQASETGNLTTKAG